jgi:hypothetical protein
MSEARTEWIVPEGTEPGYYRLSHKGNAKLIFGGLISYRGHSRAFQVRYLSFCLMLMTKLLVFLGGKSSQGVHRKPQQKTVLPIVTDFVELSYDKHIYL